MISLSRHTITASQEGAFLRPQRHTSFHVGGPPSINKQQHHVACNRVPEVLDEVEGERTQPSRKASQTLLTLLRLRHVWTQVPSPV
ncbi:hypothetical protein CGCSCA5_v009125 [Colletotrichum siamense]|nr:hypothetical protein CGCSCA5_v009125 [Colletotrichum siamense]